MRFAIVDLPMTRLPVFTWKVRLFPRAKCGAQRAEFIQEPSQMAVQQLLDHADVIKRVTIAPELPGALEAIEDFTNHEISVSGGHSDAWDEDARSRFRPRHAQRDAYI